MSYARWEPGESDVYVYHSTSGNYVCFGCAQLATIDEMIAHLEDHRANGALVPQYALDRLVRERRGVNR